MSSQREPEIKIEEKILHEAFSYHRKINGLFCDMKSQSIRFFEYSGFSLYCFTLSSL